MSTKLNINFLEEELENTLCLLQVLKGLVTSRKHSSVLLNTGINKKWIDLFDLAGLEVQEIKSGPGENNIKTPVEIKASGNSTLLKKHYTMLLQARPERIFLKPEISQAIPLIEGKYILLIPYAQEENTGWKLTYWQKLAAELSNSGHTVVVLNERTVSVPTSSILHYSSEDPGVIVNLFLNANLVITTNNKFAHLGGVLSVKTVVLISQLNPTEIYDYPSLVFLKPEVWCTGCKFSAEKGFIEACKKNCWALQTIMPSVVLTRTLNILQLDIKMPTQLKPKLLAILEISASTGFSTVGESILESLSKRFDTLVMAVNYQDKKRPVSLPYKIIRANMSGNDYLGLSTLPGIVTEFKPEYVFLNNDAPVDSNWIKIIEKTCNEFNITLPKYCSYLPIDGEIFKADDFLYLLQKGKLISYTDYGVRLITEELKKQNGWYNDTILKKISIAPHCVDTQVFFPVKTEDARNLLNASNCCEQNWGLSTNLSNTDFVVGWINRNQPRKNLSSALFAFSKFCSSKSNVKLLIRASPDDYGGNFLEMIKHLGIEKNTFLISTIIDDKKVLNAVYNSLNVFLSTSIAEGWGLTEHEAAACAKPLILPDNTVRKDLWGNCASLIPCNIPILNPAMCSSLGWLPDIDAIQKVLDYYHTHPGAQQKDGEKCYERALSFGTWQQTADIICNQILA